MRGWDAGKDFPNDPDGLDEIAPHVEGMLMSVRDECRPIIVIVGDVGELASQRIMDACERLREMRFDDPTIDQLLGRGRFIIDESTMMKGEPEPQGRRYGPYDADPHTKGRRRRFRTQRRT